MQTAPHSIKNASLLYVGNLSQIGNLITLTDLVLEAGQEDQLPEHPLDDAIDLRAEEDSHTEASAVAGTVEAPHKTAITKGHPDKADTAQHHLDIKSVTSHRPPICPM